MQTFANCTFEKIIQPIIRPLCFRLVFAFQAELLGQLLLKRQLCCYGLLALPLQASQCDMQLAGMPG